MNKIRDYLILGIGITVFVFSYSCRKENGLLSDTPFTPMQTAKLHNELENSSDLEDEKMNDYLFMIANAFVRISDNSELMQIVYEEAADNNGYVKYADLIQLDSRFKSLLNFKLGDLFCPTPLGSVDDPYESIVDSMIYKTVQYYPAIYVPNYLTADPDYPPLVGIGAEIDEYDNIITYVLDGDNILESSINETEAIGSTVPVIILNNGTDYVEYADTGSPALSSISTTPSSPAANEIWMWDEVTIMNGHRYEGQGKSEVRCLLTFHKSNGSYLSGGGSFQNGVEQSLIKKITAGDIAGSVTQTGVNSPVFPAAGSVSTTNLNAYDQTYITTFEYDWYASPKTVTSCSAFSSNGFKHNPRMKYSNEWYHNAICGITVHSTWLNYVNATFSFGNAKSLTKINRTQ